MYLRAHIAARRVADALRTHWRRVALGAFCGWLASSLLGAFALVGLEQSGLVASASALGLLAAAFVWGGTALGAVLAYSLRAG